MNFNQSLTLLSVCSCLFFNKFSNLIKFELKLINCNVSKNYDQSIKRKYTTKQNGENQIVNTAIKLNSGNHPVHFSSLIDDNDTSAMYFIC